MPSTLFPPTSRYYGIEIIKRTEPDGREVAYLRRRFIPLPDSFSTLQEHVVQPGERPDHSGRDSRFPADMRIAVWDPDRCKAA